MKQLKDRFMFSPGGENENSNITSSTEEKKENHETNNDEHKDGETHKPFITKVKDALQDWSNDDQADLDFDDTRV